MTMNATKEAKDVDRQNISNKRVSSTS